VPYAWAHTSFLLYKYLLCKNFLWNEDDKFFLLFEEGSTAFLPSGFVPQKKLEGSKEKTIAAEDRLYSGLFG
jgi:hypothetical protein